MIYFFFTKKPGAGAGRADSLVFAAGRVVSERFVLGCHRDGDCIFPFKIKMALHFVENYYLGSRPDW